MPDRVALPISVLKMGSLSGSEKKIKPVSLPCAPAPRLPPAAACLPPPASSGSPTTPVEPQRNPLRDWAHYWRDNSSRLSFGHRFVIHPTVELTLAGGDMLR
jgi:hypothetical protein